MGSPQPFKDQDQDDAQECESHGAPESSVDDSRKGVLLAALREVMGKGPELS